MVLKKAYGKLDSHSNVSHSDRRRKTREVSICLCFLHLSVSSVRLSILENLTKKVSRQISNLSYSLPTIFLVRVLKSSLSRLFSCCCFQTSLHHIKSYLRLPYDTSVVTNRTIENLYFVLEWMDSVYSSLW